MPKTKTFDPDEFLFDLYAMSSTEIQKIFLKELNKVKPDLEKIEVMIKSRLVDVGAKDDYGQTPLHYASEFDKIEIAKLLLEAGADLEAKDKDGLTPLHLASQWNHIQIAKLLIERGADVEAEDEYRQTPLDMARSDEMRNLLK
jgi:ankyrin repeat protein